MWSNMRGVLTGMSKCFYCLTKEYDEQNQSPIGTLSGPMQNVWYPSHHLSQKNQDILEVT